jgi:hypothetical protein
LPRPWPNCPGPASATNSQVIPPFKNSLFPATLVAVTIVATILGDLGGMPLLRLVAAACLGTYLVLRWPALGTIAKRVLVLTILLGVGVLARADDALAVALEALRPGLFLASFVACVNMLRSASRQSPLLKRCGSHILAQPPTRRFAALSLGTALAAVILLFSVLSLFGTMVARAARNGGTTTDMARSMMTVMRGFFLTPIVSPLAIPYAAISATYLDLQWTNVLPLAIPGVVLFWILGWVFDRLQFGERKSETAELRKSPDSWTVHLRLVALIASLVGVVIAVKWLLDVRIAYGVIFSVPVFAMGWLIVLRKRAGLGKSTILALRRVSAGLRDDRNELALLFSAGFAGILVAHLMPAEGLGAVAFPPPLVPAAIIAAFLLLGQIAMQPVMAFVIVAATFPNAQAVGLRPEVLYAAYFYAWSLMSITSPFNVTTLLPARLAGVNSFTVSWRWNGIFALVAALIVSLMLGAFTAFTGL